MPERIEEIRSLELISEVIGKPPECAACGYGLQYSHWKTIRNFQTVLSVIYVVWCCPSCGTLMELEPRYES